MASILSEHVQPTSPFVFAAPGTNNNGKSSKPPDHGIAHKKTSDSTTKKVSFRDMVTGDIAKISSPRIKKDLIKDNLARIEYANNNPCLPMVHFEDSVWEGLSEPWKDALVIKLLDKSVGYNTMRDRLHKLWKLSAGFQIMDNGNGYYMVKFDHAADRERVMDGGPWMMFDYYLTVQEWSQEFASPTAKVENTMVWIRFSGLNLFYYDESMLMALASAVGRPIKVDTNTLDVTRGRYARVCVEVNLNKPVVGKVWMRNHWYKVEYEGLHRICTLCGCYGHLSRECKTHTQKQEVVKGHVTPPPPLQDSSIQPQHRISNQSLHQENLSTPPTLGVQPPPLEESHGDWLMVKRKNRHNKVPSFSKTQLSLDKNPHINAKDKSEKNKSTILGTNLARSVSKNNNAKLAPSAYVAKGIKSTIGRVHKKRQRPEDGNNSSPQTVEQKHDLTHTEHVETIIQDGKKIFDLGNGIKNTVKMKDISGNGSRFMLLRNDSDDDEVENIVVDELNTPTAHHNNAKSNSVDKSNFDALETVPETQDVSDLMAT
jgi:hypothetical protein